MEIDPEIRQVLDTLVSSINAAISDATHGERKQCRAIADQVCDTLLSNGLAYWQTVCHEHVWAHPQNRWTTGVDVPHCHALIQKIMRQGFLDSEVKHPRCFERAPGAAGLQQLELNKKIHDRAEGYLPPAPKNHDMKFLAVACSHTMYGLKCIKAGCKTDVVDIALDGHISEERILSICESYSVPLQRGIKFLVIKWEVDSAIPALATFLQMCGNAGHGTENELTQAATLLQIDGMVRASIQAGVVA